VEDTVLVAADDSPGETALVNTYAILEPSLTSPVDDDRLLLCTVRLEGMLLGILALVID